jgi:heterodisulfide reductase subunit C/nitrate reductase gamma subunit
MNFNILLGLSAVVCLVGLIIRLSIWFSQGMHPSAIPATSTASRVMEALKGVLGSLFSAKIFLVIKSVFLDLLFQKRIFDKSSLRWIAHTLIFTGFILLLLMHAMHSVVTEPLFKDYQSTLNPYLFLRNLFGLMVLAGVIIAIFRRISLKPQRLRTSASDWAALIFLIVIILSGMLLEGTKMASRSDFQRMVDDVSLSDEEEIKALEAFWVQENGLVSANVQLPPSPELVAKGMEVNGDNCIECHASNKAAFASFSIAKISPLFFAILGDSATVTLFWYLHIVACLAFLAWLPFSKMFHIFSAPVSLIVKSVTGDQVQEPANILTHQMIGLSACTHCGTCSLECSSNMFYESFQNDFILPSEKVQYLKKIAAGKEHDPAVLKRMQQGLYICTSCDRCTTVCPSGINLKELFVSSRYALLQQGMPEITMLSHFSFPLALAQNFVNDHLQALKKVTEIFKKSFQHLTDLTLPITLGKGKDIGNSSFRGCFSCQRCTNICPVVRSYDNPTEALGMLPHQIMFSLGIGNTELAMGAQMIWSCSTCYLCQEHCPNQVELCDIFYTLKNGALNKIEAGANS